MVLLISSSLCATDIKPASNADGAVHTFFQHQVEEALEAFNIALHDVLIAGHGWRIGEENPEHAADVIDHQWDTRLFCSFQQTVSQLSRQVGQGFVNTGCATSVRQAKPAAIAIGLPERVPAGRPGPLAPALPSHPYGRRMRQQAFRRR